MRRIFVFFMAIAAVSIGFGTSSSFAELHILNGAYKGLGLGRVEHPTGGVSVKPLSAPKNGLYELNHCSDDTAEYYLSSGAAGDTFAVWYRPARGCSLYYVDVQWNDAGTVDMYVWEAGSDCPNDGIAIFPRDSLHILGDVIAGPIPWTVTGGGPPYGWERLNFADYGPIPVISPARSFFIGFVKTGDYPHALANVEDNGDTTYTWFGGPTVDGMWGAYDPTIELMVRGWVTYPFAALAGSNTRAGITIDFNSTDSGDDGENTVTGIGPDQVVRIDVYAHDVTALKCFAFDMVIDTGNVDYLSVAPTGAINFDPNILEGAATWVGQKSGDIVAVAYANDTTPDGANGDGLLAEIRIRTKSSFTTSIQALFTIIGVVFVDTGGVNDHILDLNTYHIDGAINPDDATPPDPVIDLAATPSGTDSAIILTWTTPLGGAVTCLFKYSANPILTETDWEDATLLANADFQGGTTPTPDVGTATVIGLPEGDYNFAMKTMDSTPNVSGLSNDAPTTTYTVSGTAGLADNPPDSSGSEVCIGSFCDSTDSHGAYSISNVSGGTYAIIATHSGYYPDTVSITVPNDTIVDIQLTPLLLPDLTISSRDVSFEPELPVDSGAVTISVKVHNEGVIGVDTSDVDIYGIRRGTGPIPAGGSGTTSIEFSWFQTPEGCEDIPVEVDSDNLIPELNEGNNTAHKMLYFYHPGNIHLTCEPLADSVSLGGHLEFSIQATNGNPGGDDFTISVGGLEPSWYTLSPDSFHLVSGGSRLVSLGIDVPPLPVHIGDHPFDLRLYSKKLERSFRVSPSFTVNFNPTITNLSPPDSIITGSNDVTFSWRTAALTSTELYYRSDTDTGYTSVLGLSGREHSVAVRDLPRNHWYYWWVKSRGSWGGTDSSEVRTFYVSNGIIFTHKEYYFGVNHDYDQRVSVGVVNTDSVPHDLLVKVENPYEDIIVGFVDSGSEDDIIPLNPNQTADVTLAIHAQDAGDIDYSFPLSLVSVNRDTIRDFAIAHVRINVPHIDVSFEEMGVDQGTLAKNLRITNNGDPLTDLAAFASDEIADKVYFQPAINHAFVPTGELVDFKAIPTLSLEDSSGKGIVWEDGKVISFPSSLAKAVQGYLIASYLGRRDSLYADFSPPPGERIWLAHLDNPGLSVKVHDWYCNNRANIDIGFQVPSGVTAENIESCELRMEFTPKSGWHHKNHDVHIYVNDHKVGELLNLIPDGTYVFPVDSSFLNLSPSQVTQNEIELRTKHMNGGHYVLTTNIEVFFCLSEYERYISALSQEEANERVWNLSGLIRPADEVTVNIQQPIEGTSIDLGTQTVIQAEVVADGLPGLGQMATATFSNGDEDLILYDDGQHNDGNNGDGIYGNIWGPQHQGDSCLVMVTAGRCGAWGSDTISVDIVGPSSLVVNIQSPANGFVVRIPNVQLIRATVRDNFGNPIPGSQTDSVKAVFSTGDGDSILYDDGRHGDYQANDGIYANTWRPTNDGACTVTVTSWHPTLVSGSNQVSGDVLPIQEVVTLGQLSIRADRFVDIGGGVYRAEDNVSIGNQLGSAFYLLLGVTSTLTFDVNTVTISQAVYVNPAITTLGLIYPVDNIVTFSVDPATGAVSIEGTVHYSADAIFQSSLSGSLVLNLNDGTLGGNIRFDDSYFGVIEASAGSWKLDESPFFGLNMEVDLPAPIGFTDLSLLRGKVTVGVFMDRGIFRIGLTGGALEFEESGGAFGFDLGSFGLPVSGMLDFDLSDLSVTAVEDISIQIYTPTKGQEPRTSDIQARLRQKSIVPSVETGRSGPNSHQPETTQRGAVGESSGSEKTVLIDVGITIKKGTTIRLSDGDPYIYGHVTLDLDLVKYVHFTAAEAIIELDWANDRFSFQAWKGIKLGDIFKIDEVESKIILDLAQHRFSGSTRYYPFYFHGVAFKGSLEVVLQEDHREFSGVIEQNFDLMGISFMANGASITLDESGFHSYGKLHFLLLLDANAHFTFAPEIVEGSFDTEFWVGRWKFGGKNSFNFKPERECMSATASVWLCPLGWLDWCPGGEVTFELCSHFPYFSIGLPGFFASLACPADLQICNCEGVCDDSLAGFQSYLVDDSIRVILISRDALDLGCGYTIRVEGWDEGTFDLGLFYPDMVGEIGYYATYWGRATGDSSVSEVDINSSPDFMMRTDLEGDGIFETTEPPDSSGEADLNLSLPVVTAVNVERTSPSSAWIRWDTNVPTTSQVEYGLTTEYDLSSPFDSTLVLHHSVDLPDILADTTYHFRVISHDDEGRCATSMDMTFACSGKGDVDANGQINVLDIIRIVNIILHGIDNVPEPPSHEYQLWAGDCNCDGMVNILDIILVVNCILYDKCEFCEEKALAKASGTQKEGTAEIGFLESSHKAASQGASFAIGLKSSVPVAGLQLELEYEPKEISSEKVKGTRRSEGLTITSHAEGGRMTVLVYSLKGEAIDIGEGSILELSLKVSSGLLGRVNLHLKEAVLADKDGQPVATKITHSEVTPLPKEFALSQNYPNPFNPVTVIKYALPENCNVKLTIYNILGQKVASLVDGKQKAGYKTVRWDASPLSSAIYFYRLQAGNFVQTRKMVLLK